MLRTVVYLSLAVILCNCEQQKINTFESLSQLARSVESDA